MKNGAKKGGGKWQKSNSGIKFLGHMVVFGFEERGKRGDFCRKENLKIIIFMVKSFDKISGEW